MASMIRQSTAATLLCLLSSFGFAEERTLSILGDVYTESSPTELDGSSIHEFVRSGETLDSWARLLTVQCHPSATRLADVLNPYLRHRQEFLQARPAFYRSPNDGEKGLLLLTVLGAKGAGTFEFVIARFIEQDELGVAVIVLSEKHATARTVRIDDGESMKAALIDFDLARVREICAPTA